MPELLSPRQVARAIGVSESSLKRWCDRGLIPMVCTAGGHRRLPLAGVLEFLRTQKRSLVHPEAIGLSLAGLEKRNHTLAEARELLIEGLTAGNEALCRQLLLNQHMQGQRFSAICDDLLAAAFHDIGRKWECKELEVYRERRACRITLRILHELRSLAAQQPEPTAPLAMGGTPEGDFYDVPTSMVELVLLQNGWRATSLGSSLPFATLRTAIAENQPRLFWLSVSFIKDETQFLAEFESLREVAGASTTLVIGGRGLTLPIRERLTDVAFCPNLQEFETWLAAQTPITTNSAIEVDAADMGLRSE